MTVARGNVPRAWLVRGSKDVRFDSWMLESGYTGIGFPELGSLAQAPDLQAMKKMVAQQMPGMKKGSISAYAAQLNSFVNKIAVGDLVVLPQTKAGLLAFGTVTGDYEYLPESSGLTHVRKVTWDRVDVSRGSINQDLLYSLGAFSTVCEIKRNDAAWRLWQVHDGAETDPGARAKAPLNIPSADADVLDSDEAIAADGQDIIRYSRDRILVRIREQYAGHALQDLIAEILRAEGMTCKVPPKGADGGIDIIAGSGVLGISSPTIIVQVKSQPTHVGSQVLDQLGGVVSQHQADHGLLVALGGLTAQANEKVNSQRLRVAVWDAEEVLNRLLEHYDVMPDTVKRAIPLRKTWLIDESETV
ncbi:restriction endonuclease [Pseudoclavibacter sp. 13-3]|uniref:restriction endonuclease n=1 Tax=Pseudoclavibacter sp. 13-3 TaxID=2901228 RepID=UPI001E29FB25|nr:restriction endonuclease [Pseudoclavibacter sp. 13-3]MCD7100717.1 restriction endonuclease [Pseudoclavibacter sp. 13-3]